MRVQRTSRRRSEQGGFTLIELLVVIIILGILSAVVVFAVRGTGDKGAAAAYVTDVKTIRTAQAIATAFAGPTFSSCAKDAFGADVKRNAPPGASTGSVEIAPLDLPKLGEATFAYRVKAGVDMGVKITIFQDLTYVFKGDAVARVTYLNPGAPFDPALQPTLVQKVVGRA